VSQKYLQSYLDEYSFRYNPERSVELDFQCSAESSDAEDCVTFEDISSKDIAAVFDTPAPYVKCGKCGADIWLNSPPRVFECSYVATDQFERKLQEKQRCSLIPVLRMWRENPKRFQDHYVVVLCSRACAAGTQWFKLGEVLWCG
jgi:hypothetical protein